MVQKYRDDDVALVHSTVFADIHSSPAVNEKNQVVWASAAHFSDVRAMKSAAVFYNMPPQTENSRLFPHTGSKVP